MTGRPRLSEEEKKRRAVARLKALIRSLLRADHYEPICGCKDCESRRRAYRVVGWVMP